MAKLQLRVTAQGTGLLIAGMKPNICDRSPSTEFWAQ